MRKTAKISSTIILVTVILIVVNILSENYSFRLDLTEGKEYTLSEVTRNILKTLEKPVTITAYFSRDLPPNIGNITENHIFPRRIKKGNKVHYLSCKEADEASNKRQFNENISCQGEQKTCQYQHKRHTCSMFLIYKKNENQNWNYQ